MWNLPPASGGLKSNRQGEFFYVYAYICVYVYMYIICIGVYVIYVGKYIWKNAAINNNK